VVWMNQHVHWDGQLQRLHENAVGVWLGYSNMMFL